MLLIQHAPDKHLTGTCNSTGMIHCCLTVLVVIVSQVEPNETPQLGD